MTSHVNKTGKTEQKAKDNLVVSTGNFCKYDQSGRNGYLTL